jgi:hypothetical protein
MWNMDTCCGAITTLLIIVWVWVLQLKFLDFFFEQKRNGAERFARIIGCDARGRRRKADLKATNEAHEAGSTTARSEETNEDWGEGKAYRREGATREKQTGMVWQLDCGWVDCMLFHLNQCQSNIVITIRLFGEKKKIKPWTLICAEEKEREIARIRQNKAAMSQERQGTKDKLAQALESGMKVVFDCSFDELMKEKVILCPKFIFSSLSTVWTNFLCFHWLVGSPFACAPVAA